MATDDTALLDWADANGHHDVRYASLREELRDRGSKLEGDVRERRVALPSTGTICQLIEKHCLQIVCCKPPIAQGTCNRWEVRRPDLFARSSEGGMQTLSSGPTVAGALRIALEMLGELPSASPQQVPPE